MFAKNWFFDLERHLVNSGLDSDSETFDVLKKRLSQPVCLSADDFARQAIYVILSGGFSQKTAKKVHAQIMDYLIKNNSPKFDDLFAIFHNKNKINAIIKIWENRQKHRDFYYDLDFLDSKLDYLSSLPHIGKITANHLARNLGEDIVKYDIWIQRIAVRFREQSANSKEQLSDKINNQKLNPEIKKACDDMFAHLVNETGLQRGYIDVVLWKAAQNHLIDGI